MSRTTTKILATALLTWSGMATAAPPNIEGLWRTQRFASLVESAVGTSGVLKTIDGQLPPYAGEAQNLLWHRIDMEQRGTPVANTQDTCRPRLPYAMLNLYLGPFEILQADDKIVVFFEADGDLPWTIHMNRAHPKRIAPSYFGDSVGHWEGDTLVVDSRGFNGLPWLDGQGSPISGQAHIVMRLRKTEGKLHLHVTLDDPVHYTQPWSYEYWAAPQRDGKFFEVHCLENIRAENNARIVYENLTPPPGVFVSSDTIKAPLLRVERSSVHQYCLRVTCPLAQPAVPNLSTDLSRVLLEFLAPLAEYVHRPSAPPACRP